MPESSYFSHRTIFQTDNVYEHSLFQCVSCIKTYVYYTDQEQYLELQHHGSCEIHMGQSTMHELTSDHWCAENLLFTATYYA
jgi:hypothetical protein